MGSRRPPRAGRPRPVAPGQRERQANCTVVPVLTPDGDRRAGAGQVPPPPDPAPGPGRRRLHPLRRRALRRQGPHPPPGARAPLRARVRRDGGGRCHPGLPEGRPPGPGRDDRLLRHPPEAAHRPPGQGCVLGHRDRPRPGRGVAGPGLRPQGGDRRQLRALRRTAARQPRTGAGRIRQPQPALARLRRGLRPGQGHSRKRLRGPAPVRDGGAAPRRRPAHGPAAAGLRPGRRARARHGLPGPAAAGEHRQRELRATPLRRGSGPGGAARPAGSRRPARTRASGATPGRPTRPTPAATSPNRWPNGAEPRSAPPSPPPSTRSARRR